MTRKEVAALWRVTVRTVMRWEALGRIRPLRIGGTIRFTRREVIRAAEKYQYGGESGHDPSMG